MNYAAGLLLPLVTVMGVVLSAPSQGAESLSDAELFRGAQARIENHRKADATVLVVDDSGNPVPSAKVTIEQKRHEFLFGCNFFQFDRVGDDESEQAYRSQFSDLFNYATLGFYWPSYERLQGEPQHDYAREVATWCKNHGITTKGHPLAWNYSDPSWLPDDSDLVRNLQMQRISDCVSQLAGVIDYWDVVNEATHFDRAEFVKRAPKMTKMWSETGRIEFVAQCFEVARAANPQATLLINDYRVDPSYAELLRQLTEKMGKRPFDTIGLQSHMHGGTWDNRKIWEVCNRFEPFDVPLHFTELTVVSGERGWERARSGQSWPSTPQGEQSQADDVSRIYTMLFSHPSVTAITWWDFSDRRAWQRAPAGLIREDMSPKPAYIALKDLVKKRWWTSVEVVSGTDGRVAFRGFLGDYIVTVKTESAVTSDLPFTIKRDEPNVLKIQLR